MKNLYIIGGTMGVGKTAVSQQLKSDLPNSVFLDGEWYYERNFRLSVNDRFCPCKFYDYVLYL